MGFFFKIFLNNVLNYEVFGFGFFFFTSIGVTLVFLF